jgi:hypothetical protein
MRLLLRWAGLAVLAVDVVAAIVSVVTTPPQYSVNVPPLVVWGVLIALHATVIVVVTGRRATPRFPAVGTGVLFGLVGVGLWALLCLMAPDLPTSNVPATVSLAAAAITAVLWTGLSTGGRSAGGLSADGGRSAAIAGFTAATTVALLATLYIDIVLPHLGRWVTTSAPPYAGVGPHAPHRLVDPVGLYILSGLLAATLLAMVVASSRPSRAVARTPAAAPVPR